MKPTRIGGILCALGLLALPLVVGTEQPQCTPVPVEPGCTVDDDCEGGSFCAPGGACQSFTACATDDDCAKVPTGCCPCSMGGGSTAINGQWVDTWDDSLGCPPAVDCPAVYLCDDSFPACVDGACALVAPAEVQCGAAVEAFPEIPEACLTNDDCALVFHQINCCGTEVAWGIRRDALATFSAAERACRSQMYHCGCATFPTEADDGNTGWGEDAFGVRCQEGRCFSFVR